MTYEQGFSAGERAAFFDRRNGSLRQVMSHPINAYDRGYTDGYTPRSPEWLRLTRQTEGQEVA
jgi:hypothetical protein